MDLSQLVQTCLETGWNYSNRQNLSKVAVLPAETTKRNFLGDHSIYNEVPANLNRQEERKQFPTSC